MSQSALLTNIASQPPAVEVPKRVSVLGATGSIGCSAIALLKAFPEQYRATVLTAQNNVDKLIEQAIEIRPDWVVIGNEAKFPQLKEAMENTGISVAAGAEAIVDAASYPADIVLGGIVGAAGLAPIFAAIRQGATVGIANKEPLVCAGELIRKEAAKYNATVLPIDSEHNAIFQVFDFEQPELVEKIILTASGGPFRTFTLEQMRDVTAAHAVKHPNWQMGAKISVDSATMVNKGLEMIEAYQLFPVRADQIEAIIHPQSIVHSLVEYRDGSLLAQMGPSDMSLPIAYAMSWPKRIDIPMKRLNLAEMGALHFEPLDPVRFPALRLARLVLEERGITPIIFNAANEIAVEAFLQGRIGFLDIATLIERALEYAKGEHFTLNTLEDVQAVDHWARTVSHNLLKK